MGVSNSCVVAFVTMTCIELQYVIWYTFSFDASTGSFRVKATGNIFPQLTGSCSKDEKVKVSKQKRRLQQLLVEVGEVAEEDVKMLERSSDVVIGMRIIQQFVIDLLGRNTPIAIIFRTKTEAE